MANKARGETAVEIGGVSYTVSLCLGALAEIEDAFGVDSFEAALDFTVLSARKLRLFMLAILKGNGVDVTADVRRAVDRMDMPAFMVTLTELVESAGLEVKAAGEAREGGAPLAGPSAGAPG